MLSRFSEGGGTLLDLEFLQDKTGRRVAAFGYHAGYVGAALAIKTWAWQLEHPEKPLLGVKSYSNEAQLLDDIRAVLQKGQKIAGKSPKLLIIGALGRCGRGAVDLCQKIAIPDSSVLKWDLAETSLKSGPYPEIIVRDGGKNNRINGLILILGRSQTFSSIAYTSPTLYPLLWIQKVCRVRIAVSQLISPLLSHLGG